MSTTVLGHSQKSINKLETDANKFISQYSDISKSVGNKETLIKSKERVKDLAEVFTARKEVEAMLSLIPNEVWEKPESTFLEPSCGDGNFIELIIEKKLNSIKKPYHIKKKHIEYEYEMLTAISSVYGIDICSENISRCKDRVRNYVKNFYSLNGNTINPTEQFLRMLDDILECNYINADTLNESSKIIIVQWERPLSKYFRKKYFRFEDLSTNNSKPLKQEEQYKYNGK